MLLQMNHPWIISRTICVVILYNFFSRLGRSTSQCQLHFFYLILKIMHRVTPIKDSATSEIHTTTTSRISSRMASPSRNRTGSGFATPPLSPRRNPSDLPPVSDDTSSETTAVASIPQTIYPSASTSLSPSASESGTPMTMIYHGLTPSLALVALLPTTMFNARRGMLGFNIVWLMEGVQKICEAEMELRTF